MGDLSKTALKVYKPPFKYHSGYIWDNDGHMVADDENAKNGICRIRGWGMLQHLKSEHSPSDLQDAIGEHIAKALTEYWEKYQAD